MNQNELVHFGIKGMKWGVRRSQKKNGTRTSSGKKRYSDANIGKKKPTKASSKNRSGKKKTKKPASVVASLGKVSVANVFRYKQNQHAYDAVGGMLSGDLGSTSYNSLASVGYGSLNKLLYD